MQELADRGIFVISDETYMQFVYDADHWSAASVPGWRRNVVVIGTFSKSFAMMGWRVGFVLADRAICEQATKIQDAMIICAPMISQMVAEGAVTRRVGVPAAVSPRVRPAASARRRQARRDSEASVDADRRRVLRVRSRRRLHRLDRARRAPARGGARRHDSRCGVRPERRGLPAALVRFGIGRGSRRGAGPPGGLFRARRLKLRSTSIARRAHASACAD